MPIVRTAPSTTLEMESEILGQMIVDGADCTIRVGRNVTLNSDILIYGAVSGAVIEIADNCVLAGEFRLVRGHGGHIRIGEGTTFNQVGVSLHEGARVSFGHDCMLSTDIHMDPSDMHPIFDRGTGERLNPPQDIVVGDHVWLGTRVLLLKGAEIGSGSIVGAGAMVAGKLGENVLAQALAIKFARSLSQADFNHLCSVVPFINGGTDIQALVAL